ncbi:MAG TPA: fatty acid hydroxylase [Flammeovirgaceae bacterium]|nr:fatty acid hydroxylase [Flammeovirgaceae bacterium]
MEKQFDRIPEHLKPRNVGTDTLFKNSFMEKLTRTHISIPITMHLIIVGIFIYKFWAMFEPWAFVLLFLGGWLTWTFAEYWVHRWLYHVKTDNKILLRIQHVGHGIHHQYPKDPTRLAMPPVPALILITLFFSLFWLIMRDFAFAFFPGFLFGYIMYITLHYFQHLFKPPKFKPLNRLWKWHALHHYKYPETKAFGVSTNLWDVVFGTQPKDD